MRHRSLALTVVGVTIIGAALGVTHMRVAHEPVVGGIYSIRDGPNEFGSPREYRIAKILAVDEAIHVRVYRGSSLERSKRVDVKGLMVGASGDREPGVDHMPVSRAAFASMSPVLIIRSTVTPAELASYQEWKNTYRGVWM